VLVMLQGRVSLFLFVCARTADTSILAQHCPGEISQRRAAKEELARMAATVGNIVDWLRSSLEPRAGGFGCGRCRRLGRELAGV
jgi:hypothetical protein